MYRPEVASYLETDGEGAEGPDGAEGAANDGSTKVDLGHCYYYSRFVRCSLSCTARFFKCYC